MNKKSTYKLLKTQMLKAKLKKKITYVIIVDQLKEYNKIDFLALNFSSEENNLGIK